MAGIRKRTWKNKSGKHTSYEITWVVDGKQYRKSGYESLIDAQVDLANVITGDNSNVKFGVLAENYLKKHCELNCKQSTQLLYKAYKKVHLQDFSNKIARNITKSDIMNLVLEIKNKGVTNKTVNGIITFVLAVLNYSVEMDLLKGYTVPKIKKLVQIKPEIKSLNETQMKVFLDVAKNDRFYAFFATALNTGMRRGELLALEWADIDFKNSRLKVNKQLYKGIAQPTKTNKERIIDIPDNLLNLLKHEKQNCNILTKYVFHGFKGQPIHPYYMEEKHFRPIIDECNKILDADNQITKFRFHDLRHTYATYLLSNGVPVKYVQKQLGHASAKMTLDVYASFMPSVKFGALDMLNKLQNDDTIEHKLSTEN